jgi:hypothetical protein
MKPCEIPCPKCGSLDIHRNFYLKGDVANHLLIPRHSVFITPQITVERKPGEYFFGMPSRTAAQDCFLHKCKCCGWTWETEEIYKPET